MHPLPIPFPFTSQALPTCFSLDMSPSPCVVWMSVTLDILLVFRFVTYINRVVNL